MANTNINGVIGKRSCLMRRNHQDVKEDHGEKQDETNKSCALHITISCVRDVCAYINMLICPYSIKCKYEITCLWF